MRAAKAALLLATLGLVAVPAPDASAAGESLSLSPAGVLGAQQPIDVTVTAGNLDPYRSYSVSLDGSYLADLSGYYPTTITATLAFPGVSCGEHRVELDTPIPGSDGVTAVATAGYRVYCPSMALAPARALGSALPASITVRPGDDFDYASNDRAKTVLVDGVVVGSFRYHQPITLPPPAACGAHTVRLVQPSSVGMLDASAPFQVLCPQVALTPDTVESAAQPTPVTVSASGYDPGARVTITLDGAALAQAVTDGSGAVATPVTVSGQGCGTHQVTVTELVMARTPVARLPAQGPSASAPLTVLCPAPGRPGRAAIAVDPALISAGMTTHVTGSGFTPGAAVALSWQLGSDSSGADCGAVVADAAGRVDTWCLLLQHDPTGARLLVATQPGVHAQATAVVQGGTMQPSGTVGQILFRR